MLQANSDSNSPAFNDTQLTLEGSVGYQIHGNRVVLSIDRIANNRNFDNISGTLSVELWALQSEFTGGDFTGHAMAATMIGEISGQHFIGPCQYDLELIQPPAGEWTLCVMLREWNGAGHDTRAFTNFPIAYVQAATKPQLTVVDDAAADGEVVELKKVREQKQAEEAKQETKEAPAAKAAPAAKKAESAKAAPAKKATKAPARKVAVSVNNGTSDELSSIGGISARLAANIVKGRPYKSVDDVVKVKGVGAKLLERVRDQLTL